MTTALFVPKRIRVGFKKDRTTYFGEKAFVTYFDEKGVLRKEKSWNDWRDKSIPDQEFDNVPVSGFVINKNFGGVEHSYGRYTRKTYIGIWDPRGFEVEIDVPNLLYILQSCNCIAGEGIEGSFVYAWDGVNLVLMPTNAPEYMEVTANNAKIHKSEYLMAKEFVVGHIYKDKKNNELIYLGCFDYWDYDIGNFQNNFKTTWYAKKRHHFATMNMLTSLSDVRNCYLIVYADINKKFLEDIGTVNDTDVAAFFEAYKRNKHFSPVNESFQIRVPFTFEEFEDVCKLSTKNIFEIRTSSNYGVKIERTNNGLYKIDTKDVYKTHDSAFIQKVVNGVDTFTVKEIFEAFKPAYNKKVLMNGLIHEIDLLEYNNYGIAFDALLGVFEKS